MANTPVVAILAGGLATRLRPITETIPKAMVEVAGRPFLAHQLELLTAHGLRDIVLCVGHLGEQIESAFGDGKSFGVRLRYSYDGPVLCGTAGALRRALPLLGESFFVLYGDSYLEIEYAAVVETFQREQATAIMTVIENSGGAETSNVWFEKGQLRAYDKKKRLPEMRYIDYGFSGYRSELLAQDDKPDLAAFQSELAQRGLLRGYEVHNRYYEIGSHSGLQALEEHLAKKG